MCSDDLHMEAAPQLGEARCRRVEAPGSCEPGAPCGRLRGGAKGAGVSNATLNEGQKKHHAYIFDVKDRPGIPDLGETCAARWTGHRASARMCRSDAVESDLAQ